ncbi:MAG: transposase [Rhodobacteraceae bacterium]|nr:transposase [Paracoccaceae bacterium]
MLGGAASLLCAMFAEAGLPLVHTPGLAVNRARQGIRGGERKSDPKDAVVIAELARTRPDLRAVEPPDPLDAEIRLWSAAAASSSPSRPGVRRACATCSPASFRRWSGASTPPPAPALCFSAIMPRPRISAPQGQSASPAG